MASSPAARAAAVAKYNASPKRRLALVRYQSLRRPIRRLEARIARKLDLMHQLEAQLGLAPQDEVSR